MFKPISLAFSFLILLCLAVIFLNPANAQLGEITINNTEYLTYRIPYEVPLTWLNYFATTYSPIIIQYIPADYNTVVILRKDNPVMVRDLITDVEALEEAYKRERFINMCVLNPQGDFC